MSNRYRDDGDPAYLRHGWSRLVLHELQVEGPRHLLLLHGLGEATPEEIPEYAADWPGSIYGLDLSGHGHSSRSVGGGYVSEYLVGDVDIALARIGPSTIVGRGLGAYVALLVAGARPGLVRGLVLCDGRGLAGGAATPGVRPVVAATPPIDDPFALDPDPLAVAELDTEWRLPHVARDFATAFASAHDLGAGAIAVCATERPPWLAAIVDAVAVWQGDVATAIKRFATSAAA